MSIITCIVMHDDNNNHQCCRMLNQGFIVREEEVSLCKKRKEKKRSHYLKKKRRRGLRQEPSLWSSSYVWFYTYATNLVSQSFVYIVWGFEHPLSHFQWHRWIWTFCGVACHASYMILFGFVWTLFSISYMLPFHSVTWLIVCSSHYFVWILILFNRIPRMLS